MERQAKNEITCQPKAPGVPPCNRQKLNPYFQWTHVIIPYGLNIYLGTWIHPLGQTRPHQQFCSESLGPWLKKLVHSPQWIIKFENGVPFIILNRVFTHLVNPGLNSMPLPCWGAYDLWALHFDLSGFVRCKIHLGVNVGQVVEGMLISSWKC